MRLKSKWHDKDISRSVDEIAGVLAFNLWRVAIEAVDRMGKSEFKYRSGLQHLAVIGEFLIFSVQVVDRLASERMEEEPRRRLITAVALRLAATMAENCGDGSVSASFIERFNERGEAYADCTFSDGRPGYSFLRYFAACIDELMGGAENKWVVEQVMEVEAPAVLKSVGRAVDDLLSGWKAGGDDQPPS